MKKLFLLALLSALAFTSCGPAPIPTELASPSPASIPTATATERPHALLQLDASIYSGPGNIDFDSLGALKAGDIIYPLGVYGDFVQAQATIGGNTITGFIYKNALSDLPANLSALGQDNVPLKPIYDPACTTESYDPATDTLTLTNQGNNYFDLETSATQLNEPLRIKIGKLSAKGTSYVLVKVLGISETQDPWWKGITRMDIENNHGYYEIGVRDGTMEGYNISWDLPLSISQPIQIVFDQVRGKSFAVLDKDGKELKHIDLTQQSQLKLPDGLFPQGNVYIGTSTAPQSTSFVTGFSAGVIPDGKWVDQPDNGLGLADLAKKDNLTIGTVYSIYDMTDIRNCKIMKKDFNLVSIGDFSWKGYWLGQGQYDFSVLDKEIDYANQMGWRVRAMHLVWGAPESAIPDWLLKGIFTRDQYIQILQQHVKVLVERYKGRVQEWSIANEAPARSFYPGADFWNDKIGPDYVEMAFRWAREADPNGVLIFNQDNNESPRDYDTSRTIDKMYYMLKKIKDDGAPVDVVGMQMHLFLPWNSKIAPKEADVVATMKKFAALGVRIDITEMDVDLARRPGTQTDKLNYQAQLYRDMLSACLVSKVCDSFETWGVSDTNSWITCQQTGCVNDPNGEPLMFDKNYEPKPAYLAVRDVLTNFPSMVTAPTP